MNEPLLSVKNLRIEYQTDLETVKAVNNIFFDIKKGETFGIVGETGAGKSTTALSILRLLPQRTGKIREGSISFGGFNLLNESDHAMQQSLPGKGLSFAL